MNPLQGNPLWLHAELLKLIYIHADQLDPSWRETELITPEPSDFYNDDDVEDGTFRYLAILLPTARIFDCRSVPLDFIIESGISFLEEPPEVRAPIRIPFEHCYFEFNNKLSIFCTTPANVYDENGKYLPFVFAKPIPFCVFQGIEGDKDIINFGTFANDANANAIVGDNKYVQLAGNAVIGVLDLLRDNFIGSELVPDLYPHISKKRMAKGKHPLSADRMVLTLNVAALRHSTNRSTPLQAHESPCLHWRRGHWRLLHRFSEFERQTWVKRCLVGDPDKGYTGSPIYRVISQQPLIAPN